METKQRYINRKTAKKALVCFDVDYTLLPCNSGEEFLFKRKMGPALLNVAKFSQVAIITANGLAQLTERLIVSLIELIVKSGDYSTINNFHFFSNGAGVYVHIPNVPDVNTWKNEIIDGEQGINSKYIVSAYTEKTAFTADEILIFHNLVEPILREAQNLQKPEELCNKYLAEHFDFKPPHLIARNIVINQRQYTTQFTVKPLISEAYLRSEFKGESDIRSIIHTALVKNISNESLNVSVRKGGKTSIDITRSYINKSYALNYLVKKLHIDFTNVIYIGDEFFEGGNDFCICENPDILCFAVNANQNKILHRHVITTIPGKYECDGTLYILKSFARYNRNKASGSVAGFKQMYLSKNAKSIMNRLMKKTPNSGTWLVISGLLSLIEKGKLTPEMIHSIGNQIDILLK